MTTIENTTSAKNSQIGNWAFIGPEQQMAYAPHNITLIAAKNWLKKELRNLGLADRNSTWQVAP